MENVYKLFFFSGILMILFFSCNKTKENKLPIVDVNIKELTALDPDLLTPTDAKLSQIAENIHIVALETDTAFMLSDGVKFQVGNKYIIAEDKDGIYQFSIDGSFIRKLASVGRGPEEISLTGIVKVVEPEDMLMVVSKNYDIHYYRLSDGEFLGTRGRPGLQPQEVLRQCQYIGDSTILYSYSVNGLVNPDMSGCGVRIQELGGKVLWQHHFDYNSMTILSPEFKYLSGSRIFLVSSDNPDEYILQIEDQDTVYKLNTSTYLLQPDFLKRIEKVKVDGFPVGMYANNCTVETEEFARINGYQLINYSYVEEVDLTTAEFLGVRYLVLYDSNSNNAYRIEAFENDYLGFLHATVGYTKNSPNYFPSLLQPNGKLVETYDAFTFLKFSKEALANPELNEVVRNRLMDLRSKITETSNPILVIGHMKKKIDL
jgi:hypothetical protein